MNAMGGNGVAMGFDQLVNAMQTGVVHVLRSIPLMLPASIIVM